MDLNLKKVFERDEGKKAYAYDDKTGLRVRAPKGEVTLVRDRPFLIDSVTRIVLVAPEGFLSIGVGRCVQLRPFTPSERAYLLGDKHERSLDRFPLGENEITFLLARDIGIAEDGLVSIFGADIVKKWSAPRRHALTSWSFILGETKLRRYFMTTIALIKAARWEAVAREWQNDLWYRQVKSRAERLVRMLEKEEYDESYGI